MDVEEQDALSLWVVVTLMEYSRCVTEMIDTLEFISLSYVAIDFVYCWYFTTWQVLEDFDIPELLRDMFISIPPESFRMDISSTEIRKNTKM